MTKVVWVWHCFLVSYPVTSGRGRRREETLVGGVLGAWEAGPYKANQAGKVLGGMGLGEKDA